MESVINFLSITAKTVGTYSLFMQLGMILMVISAIFMWKKAKTSIVFLLLGLLSMGLSCIYLQEISSANTSLLVASAMATALFISIILVNDKKQILPISIVVSLSITLCMFIPFFDEWQAYIIAFLVFCLIVAIMNFLILSLNKLLLRVLGGDKMRIDKIVCFVLFILFFIFSTNSIV